MGVGVHAEPRLHAPKGIVMKIWSFVSFVLTAAFAALPARAQCEPDWLPGNGLPGIDGTVYALKN
jgi:hypothetical protein